MVLVLPRTKGLKKLQRLYCYSVAQHSRHRFEQNMFRTADIPDMHIVSFPLLGFPRSLHLAVSLLTADNRRLAVSLPLSLPLVPRNGIPPFCPSLLFNNSNRPTAVTPLPPVRPPPPLSSTVGILAGVVLRQVGPRRLNTNSSKRRRPRSEASNSSHSAKAGWEAHRPTGRGWEVHHLCLGLPWEVLERRLCSRSSLLGVHLHQRADVELSFFPWVDREPLSRRRCRCAVVGVYIGRGYTCILVRRRSLRCGA